MERFSGQFSYHSENLELSDMSLLPHSLTEKRLMFVLLVQLKKGGSYALFLMSMWGETGSFAYD